MKDFLREIPIFSGLNEEELDFLGRVASQREYPKDSYIIREDEPGISLFIVRSGAVDVVLQQPTGTPIPLSTLRSHEFFGEISLFDGKPRSATVVAREHSTIVEITRDILLTEISKHPDIALKMLAQMSQRLRRSDEIVKHFADRIYGEVSQRIEDKLAVQLDSVKTLYEATEDRAAKTLDGVEESWKRLWRLITIIVGVFTVFASAIAFLGYERYADIREVSEMAKIAETNITEVENYARSTKILRDVMLTIRKIREDTKLDLLDIQQYKPTDDTLKYIAINFSLSIEDLFNNYINKCEGIQPEVCLEAVLTTLDLKEKGDLELKEEQLDKLLSALIEIIKKSPDKDWLIQLRAREEFLNLTKEINKHDYYNITKQLTGLVKDERLQDHVKFNFALILADLDEIDDNAKMIFQRQMKNAYSEWRRTMAAIGLLQMGDKKIWKDMSQIIYKDDRESFVAALLLGQLGRERLSRLGLKTLKNNSKNDSINLIIQRIRDGGKKYYANKYMEEYCNWIIKTKLQ